MQIQLPRRLLAVAGALALTAALTLAGASFLATKAHAAPAPVTVKIDNFTFSPAVITVTAGTTVTWVNQDDIPHTVVSDDRKAFKSKVLDTDDKFSAAFPTPGTYGYFCSIHPHMVGKVVVRPG